MDSIPELLKVEYLKRCKSIENDPKKTSMNSYIKFCPDHLGHPQRSKKVQTGDFTIIKYIQI